LLPSAGVVVVWGPPKCGKSFWLFDALMHVALDGWEYRSRRTEHGPVVYISLEGNRALPRRIEAFKQRHKVKTAPFYLITDPLNLTSDHKQLIADVKMQVGNTVPVAIAIDTLNQSLAGSESKDADMAAYLRAAVAVNRAFNCLVIVVHHCGYNETRARGHSSLYGNTDAVIAVSRDAADNVVARVEISKDDESGAEVVSRLDVIKIGTDDNGDPIRSCVVEPVEAAAKVPKPVRLGDKATLALRCLHETLAEMGTLPPASNHIPVGKRTVSVEQWRAYFYAGTTNDTRDLQKHNFKNASDKLQALGFIGVWNGQVWLAGNGNLSGNDGNSGNIFPGRNGTHPYRGVPSIPDVPSEDPTVPSLSDVLGSSNRREYRF
jgi:hypothetical protein